MYTYCKKNLGRALIEACALNKANMVCLVVKHKLWFLIWLLNIRGVGLMFSYLLAITKIVGTCTHNICFRGKKYHTICFLDHTQENITFFRWCIVILQP